MQFVVLIFDRDDLVIDSHVVAAPRREEARRIAAVLMKIHPNAAGFQLWHDGERVSWTHPPAANDAIRDPGDRDQA